MKIIVWVIFGIFAASLLASAYATPYENKIIDSDSLFIQFGEDRTDFRGREIPTIQKAEINSVSIPNPEFRVMGNSFTLKSVSDNFGLITYGLNLGKQYNLRTYVFAGNEMIKWNDYSELKNPDIPKQAEIILPKTEAKEEPKPVLTGITPHILVDHYDYVTKGYEYRFAVKAFDSKLYSGSEWEKFYGKLDNVHVTAAILFGSQVKKTFDGFTKYGIFQDGVLIKDTPWPQGKYTLKVNTDYEGKTFSKELEFFVSEPSSQGASNAPTANAGPDQSVGTGSLVTLDGSGSSDPNGDALTYSWTQTSGAAVTLSDNTVASPTFTAPGSSGTLVFSLTVSDGSLTSTDEVTITVS